MSSAGSEEEEAELEEEEDEDMDEEGEDEGEEDEEDDEEDEEEEEQLEPKVLPQRTTRALRLNKLLDEEESADEDFWKQDFFAEEDKDSEFEASESEQEDIPDADFSESEDDDESDEDEVEANMRREERSRRKALKPPGAAGARRPAAARPKPLPAAGPSPPEAPLSPGSRIALKAAKEAEAAELFEAPTLRRSTKQRVEEAEKVRQHMEQTRPRKRRQEQQHRPLMQEELLAEAAQTEIENLRSLEALQAAEEEVKERAAVKRARYSGPYIHYHSKQVNGEAVTTCEVANMLLPPHMRKQRASPPKPQDLCIITGQPAHYKDPLTGQPYLDAAAFKVLRQHFATQNPQAGSRTQRRSRTGANPWHDDFYLPAEAGRGELANGHPIG